MAISPAVFEEMKTGCKLPSPSGVALRLLELIRQEDVSIEQIAHAMRADPALCGRLIKFANMALMGPRRPVVSVSEAVQLAGIGVVRQLILGFSVLGQYRNGTCKSFNYPRFWSRSLATAISAGLLCQRLRVASADEAFTCGLLSDVGSLALATLYPKEYAVVLDADAQASPLARAEVERKEFGTDHSELCAALLEDWRLPRLFVDAVFRIEEPDAEKLPQGSRDYTLAHLLSLAASIGTFCVSAEAARKAQIPDLVLAAAKIGIDADVLSGSIDHSVKDWKEWGKILAVETQDIPKFEEQAAKSLEGPVQDRTKPQSGSEPLTVLVVDDDPGMRLVLEHLLRQDGHRVALANDGKEALKLAIEINPQLVVSDWVMPEMDGVALCGALRETNQGRHMYFILLTGMVHDDQLVEAFEAGVDDYLTKPFNPRVLTARLRAADRVIRLQEETDRDSRNLRRFATELAVANRRLQQAALTDSLTGLPNRRFLMERLDQEWAAGTRSQRPFTVMMADIDTFKQVNDVHGHEVGDSILRQVGATLRRVSRVDDVVGRLGGEEFVVICPGTKAETAITLAERLRRNIQDQIMQVGNVALRVTISIGVAERDPSMKRPDEVMRVADSALYRAKRDGRNRVHGGPVAPPGPGAKIGA